MIIPFLVISATSSVSEPLTMFLLGAVLVGLSSSMPGTKKK
jgi:hypothetical protein